MSIYVFLFLLLAFTNGHCNSDIHIDHRLILAVPMEYDPGFIGRAFLLETNQVSPNFKAALSVEAVDGRYSCSLQVFLGDFKVWDSGHYSRFYALDKCVLELTVDGDLQIKGPKEKIGWRTGTFGQGVESLQMLWTGNLVLLDALNRIKWQSFNFPTDVMLWGQRFDVATRLTSYHNNLSSSFYSFEIQDNKIGLYLNSGHWKYSYWEFNSSKNRNISYIQLGSKGLLLFNEKYRKFAQIPTQKVIQPLRFLALGNTTGNLGLYFYSTSKGKFEASFQALNTSCDLPLACKPYSVCTLSNACSGIRLLRTKNATNSDCRGEAEMVELEGVSNVLRNAPKSVNSKQECGVLCINECTCVAALYELGKCYLYGMVVGVKQIEKGNGSSYMVKVPKGSSGGHGKSSVKKWVLLIVGVVDGLIILLVLGCLGYYFIRRRRRTCYAATGN